LLLSQLLKDIPHEITGVDADVIGIAYDSRAVRPGYLFVALCGHRMDGHDYTAAAVSAGAAAVVVSKDVQAKGVAVVKTPDTRRALALMSAEYFGHPVKKLKLIGITGTKGKTTTAYLAKALLEGSGHKTGLIGTIEYFDGAASRHADNTTPESYELHALFADMINNGCTAAVMEVSSQAIKLNRTAGLYFDAAVFLNLSEDHIAPGFEHETFEEYRDWKAALFASCATGIFNIDDPHAGYMTERAKCNIVTMSTCGAADITASHISRETAGGRPGYNFDVTGRGLSRRARVGIPGGFSVDNALAAIAAVHETGLLALAALETLASAVVRGRMEFVPSAPGTTILIDYAHNAVSMRSLLETLREYHPGRLICLFGCGGNRAKSRRYDMGRISGELADLTIITDDNPRYEAPADIIADIKTGIDPTGGEYAVMPDRAEGIKYMISLLKPGDIGVIAGKGHQLYQEVEGIQHRFDEREVVRDAIAQLKG